MDSANVSTAWLPFRPPDDSFGIHCFIHSFDIVVQFATRELITGEHEQSEQLQPPNESSRFELGGP